VSKTLVRKTPFGAEYWNNVTKRVELVPKTDKQQAVDYTAMKVTELRGLAESKGLDKDSKLNKKKDLVEWLMDKDG